MLESSLHRLELLPTAKDYQERLRVRRNLLFGTLIAVMLVSFSIYLVLRFFAPQSLDYAPVLALVVLLSIATPVALWIEPRIGVYLLCLCACFFLQNAAEVNHDLLEPIPFYWNISTIGQIYGKTNVLNAFHFSAGELIMALTTLFWFMRQILLREVKLTKGTCFGALTVFIAFCVFGFLRGIAAGGDVTLALWEVRALFYFYFAYLMATNIIENRQQAVKLLFLMMIGIGVKSIFGTLNYLKNPNVTVDEGVLSHEDSLLMNIIILGALVLWLAREEPKLKWGFTLFAPLAIITSLANGRRAGIACLIIALPVVLILSYALLKERRKFLNGFMVALALFSAVYVPVAWNSKSAWALPVRAIRSQSEPDERDASSDAYRMNENFNLKLTRDTSPWLGYGYGRPFIEAQFLPGRTDVFKLILPHNGILWMWMRLGHFGFIAFWFFVFSVLMFGSHSLRVLRDPRLIAMGILGIATLLMLLMYGQYDLSFANYRTMWLTGTLVGIMAILPKMQRDQNEEEGFVPEEEPDDDSFQPRLPRPEILPDMGGAF